MGAIDAALSVNHLTLFAAPFLNETNITEVCVNRCGEIWCERAGVWEMHKDDNIDLPLMNSVATAVASFNGQNVSDSRPILSAVLPTGERMQVVKPPACEKGTVSLTIRKPTQVAMSLNDYQPDYFSSVSAGTDVIDKVDSELRTLLSANEHKQFLALAVRAGKNIVISGETGSGKTTLMRTLIQSIDGTERLISIEDVAELNLSQTHANRVSLFYQSNDSASGLVTPTDCLKSCLRMKPDRILLSELRGAETFDFINIAASGHGGSITSCHAGSVPLTFDRLALMCLQSPQGAALPHEVIRGLLEQVIDVVVHVTNSKGHRHITDIRFNSHG